MAEDDHILADTLVYNLKKEGYEGRIARTGVDAVVEWRSWHPDLILLDLMLPELDGFDVCRVIRSESMVPIIMLTARDAEMDRVLGLELGADDYVVKPFSLRELIARIRATFRRLDANLASLDQDVSLTFDGLQVIPQTRQVYCRDHEVHLLPREFALLRYLMQNQGIVLSRAQLLEKVWGHDFHGESRTVDVHIRRLRQKVEANDEEPEFIRTVYGVGYTFNGASK